jgi:hypothetical protein
MTTRRRVVGSVIAGLFCWACANTTSSTSAIETRNEAGARDASLSPDTGTIVLAQDASGRESRIETRNEGEALDASLSPDTSTTASAQDASYREGGAGIEARNEAEALDANLSPDTSTTISAQDASDREDASDGSISWTDKTGIRTHGGLVPPPVCIAPCTWRAIAACMPPHLGACQFRKSGGPGTTEINSVVVCDPISGWFRAEGDFSSAGRVISVGNTAGLCFGINGGGKSPSPMPWVSDGTCPVSYGNGNSASVHCEDDGKDYVLEPSRPECAPWIRKSNPYWVTPAFECESITQGPCDFVPKNVFEWRFTPC